METKSGLPRLSGDYNHGYTKAIQDMQEIFAYVQADLQHHHKKMTGKMCSELLECCLEHRERLREKRNGFIRWNHVKEAFEFYESGREL